jgi:hypothetical protein
VRRVAEKAWTAVKTVVAGCCKRERLAAGVETKAERTVEIRGTGKGNRRGKLERLAGTV